MGGCASKPKESDILEASAVTENVVVESVKRIRTESKNVEPETVSQEKADEVVPEKKEDVAETEKADEVVAEKKEDVAETEKEAEPAKPAEVEPVQEEVKTETAQETAVETVNAIEPPKQEEAAAGNDDTKTKEEPLVTL